MASTTVSVVHKGLLNSQVLGVETGPEGRKVPILVHPILVERQMNTSLYHVCNKKLVLRQVGRGCFN
jgi:hypothetical protein